MRKKPLRRSLKPSSLGIKITLIFSFASLTLALVSTLILSLPVAGRNPESGISRDNPTALRIPLQDSSTPLAELFRFGITPAALRMNTETGIRRSQNRPATATVDHVEFSGVEEGLRKARLAVEEATRLRGEWKESSLRQAIEQYELAARTFEAAGERREQADTLTKLGEVFSLLGEHREALARFDRALILSRAYRDGRQEVAILNNQGGVYALIGENQKAITVLQRALQVGQKIGDEPGVAKAFCNLGEAYYNLSDMNRALEFLKQALKRWETLDNPGGRAQTLRYLGYAYTDMSELPLALDYFQQSLPLWRAARDLRGEAQTVNAIGLIHSLLGEREQAIESYASAEKIFRAVGDRGGIATALNGKGEVYADLNLEQALDCHDEALRLSQDTGQLEGQIISHRYLGNTHRSLGDVSRASDREDEARRHYEQAVQHYQQSVTLCRALGDRRIEAYNLQDLGGLHDFLGQTTKALDYYGHALRMSKLVKDPRGQALVLNSAGVIYARLNQKQRALTYFNRALPLTRAAQDHARESLTLYNIAHVQRDQGALSSAVTNIESAIRIIESLRAKVPGFTLRSSYFASVHSYYELIIDLRMQNHKRNPKAGFDAKALEDSEFARARSLLDMLAESSSKIRGAVAPELLEEERGLRQILNAKAEYQMNLLSGPHTEDHAATTEREIRELTARFENVEARIRRQSPHYAALTQPRALSLREIQQKVLDDDSLLLEYALGDDRSYLWAVTKTEIASFELPGRAEIEDKARRFYDLLTSRSAPESTPGQSHAAEAEAKLREESATLGKLLLAPVAARLGTKRLIIIPDGALQYIPFPALIVPEALTPGTEKGQTEGNTRIKEEPLILNHEIVNEPSASTLASLLSETAGRPPAPNSVVVFADPVFEMDDPRIQSNGASQAQAVVKPGPTELQETLRDVSVSRNWNKIPRLLGSRYEADAIIATVPWGTGLKITDFAASRATATGPALTNYRIVHFATHGLLNNDHPELSGIVLSLVDPSGQPQDGFLRLHEIYNLKLSADLVVLSACNTGLGKDVKGEGLIGLTRGFMYAGAAGVMATLWKVDDDATAELMRHFYEAMFKEGLSPSASLRKAQLKLYGEHRWHSPYFWAGFVIQGQYAHTESRTRPRIGAAEKLVGGTVITILLIVGLYTIRHRRRRTF